MNSLNISYRSDLDGLRAIAVISVVFYHFFPASAKFGFLGVDIFFVISGYLITSIIFKDISAKKFSFINFWCKRIRRLFPALIATLFVTYIFSIFILLPDEFEKLGKHMFSSAFFFYNFNLFTETGYFESTAKTKLLLHLWSLSVEGQFYLLWPVIIALVFLFNFRTYFTKIVVSLIMLSLISQYSLYLFSNSYLKIESFNFYMFTSRLWEFLAGAALVNFKSYNSSKSIKLYNSLFILSLFILIYCLFISTSVYLNFEDESLDIKLRVVFIIITSTSLIFFSSKSTLSKKILGNSIFVYMGKISYPLYLWHWPIFSMLNIIFLESPGISILIFGFLFSIVLAACTHHMIEVPFKRIKNLKKISAYLVFIMILISLIGIITLFYKGFPNRINTELKAIIAGISDWTVYDGSIKKNIANVEVNSNNSETNDEVLIIGDSYAVQYWPMVKQLTEAGTANKISFLTRQGCSPVKGFVSLSANCHDFYAEIFEVLENSKKIKKIIISSSFNYDFNGANMKLLFSDLVENLLKFANVTVITPSANGKKFDPKKLIYIKGIRYMPVQNYKNIHEQTYNLKDLHHHDDWIIPILEKKGANYIKTSILICPNAVCKTLSSERYPIYFDGSHFTNTFVKSGLPLVEKLFIK
jgi:peptidoglycan/LPS O-acetylase OafA/YrhL